MSAAPRSRCCSDASGRLHLQRGWRGAADILDHFQNPTDGWSGSSYLSSGEVGAKRG